MATTMKQRTADILESLVERAEQGEDLDVDKLRDVMDDLETGTKYATASYAMYCTNEDVLIVYNKESGAFVEIDVPMEGDGPVTVTRAE